MMARWAAATPRTQGLILLGLGFAFWLSAMAAGLLLIAPVRTVFDLGFGFGPYVREMLTHGRYADCSYAVCDHASRMPLLVFIASGAGAISRSARWAALIKDVVFAAATLVTLAWIWRRLPPSRWAFPIWAGVGTMLLIGLPVAKHAGQLAYEESISLPLLFLLGVALPLALSSTLVMQDRERLLIGAVTLGVLLYLLKSSLLLVFGVVLVAALMWAVLNRSRAVMIAVLLSLIAPLGWGIHNQVSDGRFTFMTSWEGENLRRGWNPDTYALYPVVEIDRVFDSKRIVFPDGHVRNIEPKPVRVDFPNEWAWSDTDRDVAMRWIKAHPNVAADLLFHKALNYFLSVTKTPRQTDTDPSPRRAAEKFQDASVAVWLLMARLAEVALAVALVQLWIKRPDWRFPTAAIIALAGAYAVPCLVGFNFERHITTGLVMLLGCLMAVGPAAASALRPEPVR
jgi:hypothetical protein